MSIWCRSGSFDFTICCPRVIKGAGLYPLHTLVYPLKPFAILLLLFGWNIGHAQLEHDLRNRLGAASEDTVKANLLIKLALQISTTNTDSALSYMDASLALSQKLNYPFGLMKGNIEKGILEERENKTKARDYFMAALPFAQQLRLAQYEGAILNYAGNTSYMMGEYINAEDYYSKALAIARTNHDFEQAVKSFTNLGMTYTKLTDYSRAFEMLTLSNHLADSLELRSYIGGNYIDIANIFYLQKKHSEALAYYEKAATVFQIEGDQAMLQYANIGKGQVYIQMGNYAQAISFLEEVEKSLDDPHKKFDLYQHLGFCFMSLKNFKEAEHYLLIAQRLNDRETQAPAYSLQNYLALAKLYRQNGKISLGLDLAHKAEMLARQQGSLSYSKDCFEMLSSLYEANGELAKSLKYSKQFAVVQDSIARIDQSKKLAEAETKFKLGEKDREVELLGKENDLQKVREQSSRIIIITLVAGLLLLVVAAFLLAQAYRKSKTKNELLAAQKTEIEEASVLITEQSNKLRAVDKMKSRFFANISHELRTPVTLITGMLEIIGEGHASPKEKERVQIALGNSRKLNTLVEEMLDLTRLEANKITLKKKTLPLTPLLNRVVGTFGSLVEKKNIRLIHNNTPTPIYVDLDEDKFEKIINNLIYNAIKFTPSGGWIRVVTNLSADKEKIEIHISDSGSGIAEEDLPHIFERFYQSQTGSQNFDSQGTGIGLSLVKEFTELHGGEVSACNSPGDGAQFSLCFALASPPLDDLQANVEQSVFSWTEFEKPAALLLVEDHEEMRAYVRELLGDRFTIAEAGNGVEALHWLSANEADLIISDVMMPQMDGYTFLAKIKADEKLRHIPVIMLTARAAEDDRLHGLSLGVDDYLVKPFNATELKIRTQNLLLNQASRKQWLLKPKTIEEEVIETTPKESPAFPATQAGKLFVGKVIAYIETRIQDHTIAIGDLANHLALSERQLYRKTGELTGLAPAQLIKEVRLKKAYQLLMDKKVSKLSTLATEVGYENPAYFARQFAERFGKKPMELL